MSLKFCANLSFMFQETTSLVERYYLAKKSGFRGVECASPYDDTVENVVRAKEENSLEQVLINVPSGNFNKGELGFAALPGKEQKFKESLADAVRYAKALECKLIHITSGIVNQCSNDNEKTYENNLYQAVEILKENDIIGVIEPINSYAVPNYFLNNYETAVKIIKKINSPYLKLQLDLFHLQIIKGNMTRSITELFPYIGHVQIAQIPKRNEPDTSGEIDYKYVLNLLQSLGYDKWIGLEYKPLGKTEDGLGWINKLGYCL